MAHDPTRSWPTGKGPDDTSIPGAAWLELLDGQAFPVVGAGVMVRDGNVWAPASSSNPLHVRAQALEQLIGALNATKETNPDAASASMLALLRGLIAIVGKEATLGQILAALGAPAQESTLVDVLAALTTLAGTIDSGAQKVTLSGRRVLEETIFARAIRTAGHFQMTKITPDGAIGARVFLQVYGVTGTFASDEGINCGLFDRSSGPFPGAWGVSTARVKVPNVASAIIWYPGANKGEGMIAGPNRDVKVVALPLSRNVIFTINITGTFGVGEGIDCDVKVEWLF